MNANRDVSDDIVAYRRVSYSFLSVLSFDTTAYVCFPAMSSFDVFRANVLVSWHIFRRDRYLLLLRWNLYERQSEEFYLLKEGIHGIHLTFIKISKSRK